MRWAFRLNLAVFFALALLLWGMLNYLSHRYFYRGDFNRTPLYQLSDKSLSLLAEVTNDVQVTVFLSPENSIYGDVLRLLEEYQLASDRIQVETVDPFRNLVRSRELAEKYGVDDPDMVIFDGGERTQFVSRFDLVGVEYDPGKITPEPIAEYFHGETLFSSAIKAVTDVRRPRVYFLQGHGERDLENFDEYHGYSEFAQLIRRDNIDIQSLVLGERRAIPAVADALIVAAPSKRLSQPEVDILRAYLDGNGRILMMLEPVRDAGLKPLLEDWGVLIRDDVVIDGSRTLTGQEIVVTEYGSHPITEAVKGSTTIFYFPRSIEPVEVDTNELQEVDRPRVTVLAATSESGWAETDLSQRPLRYDVLEDRPGPIGIAAAVAKGPMPALDMEVRPARMVVFGDADFVSNGHLTGGNADFLMASLNWLLEREEMMAIAPKAFEQYRLTLSRRNARRLVLILVGAIPGAFGLLGALVWLGRRA
jgi:ABC-type uncharacterized transport system involved in gliding motility auxiliary subunit